MSSKNTRLAGLLLSLCAAGPVGAGDYQDLLTLYQDWRAFERPPMLDGAPDYTREQFGQRQPKFEALRERLHAIDPSAWPIPNCSRV